MAMQPVAISDELVAAAAQGQSEALERTLEGLAPQVRIMVNARLNPTLAQTQLAEDLVQESLSSISKAISTLQRQTAGGLRAFASTIVSRRVADALRDPERLGRRAGDRSLDSHANIDFSGAAPLWAMLSASGASPVTQADHADLIPRVMSAMTSLKPEHREAITMAFFDQLDTRDLAERMNISRPAASMLLIRAVKALRRQLTGSSQVMEIPDARRR